MTNICSNILISADNSSPSIFDIITSAYYKTIICPIYYITVSSDNGSLSLFNSSIFTYYKTVLCILYCIIFSSDNTSIGIIFNIIMATYYETIIYVIYYIPNSSNKRTLCINIMMFACNYTIVYISKSISISYSYRIIRTSNYILLSINNRSSSICNIVL